jgi:hypothetical protein
MSIDLTLRKVEEEISLGKLGKARDRLHGLLSNDPKNLQIRAKLGEIYWKLQMPEIAGKYWYLVQNKTKEMIEATKAFEHYCGNDPVQILFSLKYRNENEDNNYIEEVLSKLDKKAKEKYNWYEDYRKRGGYRFRNYSPNKREPKENKLLNWGCITILIIILISSLYGIYTFVRLIL